MIVYGSKDVHLGLHSTNSLRNLANVEVLPVEGAGHALVHDAPDVFNKYFYNFLRAIDNKT